MLSETEQKTLKDINNGKITNLRSLFKRTQFSQGFVLALHQCLKENKCLSISPYHWKEGVQFWYGMIDYQVHIFTEEFLEYVHKFTDFDFGYVIARIKLSEEFLEKHAAICTEQIYLLCRFQTLSENFIKNHISVDWWPFVMEHHNLLV